MSDPVSVSFGVTIGRDVMRLLGTSHNGFLRVVIVGVLQAVEAGAERNEIVQVLDGLRDAAAKRKADGRYSVRADVRVYIEGEKPK